MAAVRSDARVGRLGPSAPGDSASHAVAVPAAPHPGCLPGRGRRRRGGGRRTVSGPAGAVAAARLLVNSAVARLTETLLPPQVVTRIRKGREWKRWVDSLGPESLED